MPPSRSSRRSLVWTYRSGDGEAPTTAIRSRALTLMPQLPQVRCHSCHGDHYYHHWALSAGGPGLGIDLSSTTGASHALTRLIPDTPHSFRLWFNAKKQKLEVFNHWKFLYYNNVVSYCVIIAWGGVESLWGWNKDYAFIDAKGKRWIYEDYWLNEQSERYALTQG